MSVAVKSDPALWARVKQSWIRSGKGGVAGKWNARKAMLAVLEYKRRGGRYTGSRSPTNSLDKWRREDWGYVDGDPAGRYLPAAVRAVLTPAEKRRERGVKRGRAGEWVPYTASVAAKMRRAGIFGPKKATVAPGAAKPRTAKPGAAKPRTAKTGAAKPRAAKPRAAKPRAAKPRAAKPKPTGRATG